MHMRGFKALSVFQRREKPLWCCWGQQSAETWLEPLAKYSLSRHLVFAMCLLSRSQKPAFALSGSVLRPICSLICPFPPCLWAGIWKPWCQQVPQASSDNPRWKAAPAHVLWASGAHGCSDPGQSFFYTIVTNLAGSLRSSTVPTWVPHSWCDMETWKNFHAERGSSPWFMLCLIHVTIL